MELEKLKKKGWAVDKETKAYTVLIRQKRFNWAAFIGLTLLLNVFGLFGYIIYYNIRKPFDERIVMNDK